MADANTLITEILSKRTDLSADQVRALIEGKKREGRGLLSDEGAALLVAEDLHVKVRGSGTGPGRMPIAKLVAGLNDVSVIGRVLMALLPQPFQKRDGARGKIMRLIVFDRSGRVACALWDKHAEVMGRAGNLQGRAIRITHAYTRQGLGGEVEVDAGDRSMVEADPPGISLAEFPDFGEMFAPVGTIVGVADAVNVVGAVQSEPRVYAFTREDGQGRVLRVTIADESGAIQLAVWNERVDDVSDLREGDTVQVINARAKLDRNARPELHAEAKTQVKVLETQPLYFKPPIPRAHQIVDLSAQSGLVNMDVFVVAVGGVREFTRSSGEKAAAARLLVADPTGLTMVSLWDDKTQFAAQLVEGDRLSIRGATVRGGQNEPTLNVGKAGRIEVTKTGHRPPIPGTKLSALGQVTGLVAVVGDVVDDPQQRRVVTEGGEPIELAAFNLRDESGSSRVVLWREQAVAPPTLRAGARVWLVGFRVKPGLGGQSELHSTSMSKIEEAPPAKTRD